MGRVFFLRGHRAVQAAGGDARIKRRDDLVFYQGEQRRYDKGQVREDERGRLKTQGLASTCGQNNNGVAFLPYAFDCLVLQWKKSFESPVFAQNLFNPIRRQV